jgi:hypothetical protein
MDSTTYKIYEELKDIKSNYEGTSLEKVSGLKRSQYKVIKMCEYYSDSRYLGSYANNKKSVGGGSIDVPFYNIVNYRVALAKTATDLDIKDIQIVADHPEDEVASMLLNREAYEWMKDSEFSKTLNDMGLTRPKYGGYLVKKTEDKDLKIEVVRWTNVWTDQNDIMAGPFVECHHLSPVTIKKKEGIWYDVDDLLRVWKKMKAADRPTAIDVYEITGEFPISIYKDAEGKNYTDKDEYTYSLQRYFCANLDGQYHLLYAEELSGELDDYYEYLGWEDNGYGLGRGVIEDSEEAQVWTNDSVINEMIAMTLAGRVGIKTTSKKLGNNILEHDHGKIYELDEGKDMNSFSFAPGALGQYQNQIEKWRTQADNVTSSFNSITGEQPPSGTPYSQTALLNQVASKPFDYKREEWGIHLTKIFDKWIIPYLIKKIKKEHILVSNFSDTELEAIDEAFSNKNVNQGLLKMVLAGEDPTPELQSGMKDMYKQHIKKQGKKRFLNVPDGFFTDIEAKVTVVTTGEQKNKAVILQSLSELMKTVIGSMNPATGKFGVLEDPTLNKIFKEILEIAGSGISPISIPTPTGQVPQAPQTPQAPAPAPASGGVSMPMSPALA